MRRMLALAAAAVALTGCGLIPGQQGSGGEEKQPTAATTKPVEKASSPPTASAAAPAQSDQVIASRTVKVSAGGDAGTAKVDITLLQRQGKIITLNWTVKAVDGKVMLHGQMGGGALDYTVSNVSLIDPVNGKRYRVARNGTGSDAACVCSGTQGVWPENGEEVTLHAVFGAPPPDVTKLNVEMPQFGVFTNVPIS